MSFIKPRGRSPRGFHIVNLRAAYNIEDLRRIAERRLPRIAYDFLERGAEEEITLAANREAFERIRFVPRTLVDVVKGIMSVEDALLAGQHGADGIFVSNHGGRQLDGAPSPIDVLPQIAAAVGGRMAIMVDSGFRRGSDIVKALALGADLVFVGRPTLYGAAAGGEEGVLHALNLLKSEVDRVMALIGCTSVEQLSTDYLRFHGTQPASARGAERRSHAA